MAFGCKPQRSVLKAGLYLLRLRLCFEGPLVPKANLFVTKERPPSGSRKDTGLLARLCLSLGLCLVPSVPLPPESYTLWFQQRPGPDRNTVAPGLLESPIPSDVGCTGVSGVSCHCRPIDSTW